jgi:hypothetical protein
MNLTRISRLTGKENTLFIPGLTRAMLDAYSNGALAQDAFDGLSADYREFIMTGITPDEWNTFLPPEEEEGEDDE